MDTERQSQQIGLSVGVRNRKMEDFPLLWCAKIVHDAHELAGLCFGFLRLRHMQVHFIAIKVSIVGAADALIEAEGPAIHVPAL